MNARPHDVAFLMEPGDHADIEHDCENDAYLARLAARVEQGAKLKRRRDLLREMLTDAEAAYEAWGNT